MRFRGMSIITVGALTLLALATPEASAQRGRIGTLRSAPRHRSAFIGPQFFNSCFIAPSFSPFFPFFGGGLPFLSVQALASSQPSPDPSSHLVPDPGSQPVPFPGSHALPEMQSVPGTQPVPGAIGMASGQAFAAPVYSAPVYTPPVYAAAAPVATPQVSGGMVVGDVIVDPTFGFWGSSFFGGGGIVCGPTSLLGRGAFVR